MERGQAACPAQGICKDQHSRTEWTSLWAGSTRCPRERPPWRTCDGICPPPYARAHQAQQEVMVQLDTRPCRWVVVVKSLLHALTGPAPSRVSGSAMG